MQRAVHRFGQHRVPRGLRGPYQIEFRLDHVSRRVERVGFGLTRSRKPDPYALSPGMPIGQPTADRREAFALQYCQRVGCGILDKAAFVVVPVNLAVGLEAAVLV